RSANPDSVIEPRSPPLPLTASTWTGRPVNGSGSSIFELVFPPPKFVMRRSAPNKLERYRRRANGFALSSRARLSSQRSFTCVVSLISGINNLAILLEAFGLPLPLVGFKWLKDFCRERAIHDCPDFLK